VNDVVCYISRSLSPQACLGLRRFCHKTSNLCHIATVKRSHNYACSSRTCKDNRFNSIWRDNMNKTNAKTKIKAIVAVGLAILGAALIAAPANAGWRIRP